MRPNGLGYLCGAFLALGSLGHNDIVSQNITIGEDT
jgi:hypothetical protein